MRILFINDYETGGGKEKGLNVTAEALREAGHITGFVYSQRPRKQDPAQEGKVFRIPGLDSYRNIRKTIEQLRKCAALFKPDVVHVKYNIVNLFVLMWLSRRFPVFRSVHDVELLCPTRHYVRENTRTQCDARCGTICFASGCLSGTSPRSWFRLMHRKVAQEIYSRWTRLSTQSEYMRKNLAAMSGGLNHVSLVPIFVPQIECVPAESTMTFLYVGRLNRWKGPQIAIQALSLLPDRCALDVVGAGIMEKELRQLVGSLHLESRVRFLGFLEDEALYKEYQKAFAVVIPSIMPESGPRTVQEAMAAGRPVIATAVGAIPEFVEEGVTGYLVHPNNPAALATAMRHLFENPGLSQTMGSNGRRIVAQEQYQRDYHVEAQLDEYSRTIEGFKKSRNN